MSEWLWEGVFLCGLLCQSVIRVSCYQNYSRNTQPALLSTLLPVLYTLLCAHWTSVCTKLRRRGRVLERYRLAQCDGGSAPCAGGAHILLSQLRAGAAALRMSAAFRPELF